MPFNPCAFLQDFNGQKSELRHEIFLALANLLEKIDLSNYLSLLSKPMRTKLSTSNLMIDKARVRALLDNDLSTMKQFVVDDTLVGIATL